MGGSTIQIAVLLLVVGVSGAAAGVLLGLKISSRRVRRVTTDAQAAVNDITSRKDQLAAELSDAETLAEQLQAEVARVRTALQSAHDKTKVLAKNVLTLREERESTKIRVSTLQDSLLTVKKQTLSLQREFGKVGDFYKRELSKSLQKRKAVETEIERMRAEHNSIVTLVESATQEHGSPKELITAAQLRMGQLEVLERNANKLEAENAELRKEAVQMKQKYNSARRDLEGMDELRIHNKQLVQCVEALENSRQQHEEDAEKFRDQADQKEQLSETLKLKLADLEENFADMERQQSQALRHARDATMVPASSANDPSNRAHDGPQDVVDMARYTKRS